MARTRGGEVGGSDHGEPNSPRGAARTVAGAAPLAVWFLLGPLSEDPGRHRIFEVPVMNRHVEITAGLVALAVALVAGIELWQSGEARGIRSPGNASRL